MKFSYDRANFKMRNSLSRNLKLFVLFPWLCQKFKIIYLYSGRLHRQKIDVNNLDPEKTKPSKGGTKILLLTCELNRDTSGIPPNRYVYPYRFGCFGSWPIFESRPAKNPDSRSALCSLDTGRKPVGYSRIKFFGISNKNLEAVTGLMAPWRWRCLHLDKIKFFIARVRPT